METKCTRIIKKTVYHYTPFLSFHIVCEGATGVGGRSIISTLRLPFINFLVKRDFILHIYQYTRPGHRNVQCTVHIVIMMEYKII